MPPTSCPPPHTHASLLLVLTRGSVTVCVIPSRCRYARLCKKLRGEEKSKKKGGEAGQATFGTRFKDGLISLTREEFSKDRTPENERLAELTKKQKTLQREGKNLSEEEDEEKYRLAIARSRMFANIKFIGELFKYDLVAEKTIHNECLAPFLKDEEAEEDAIESIATLLNTSGSKLDATKSKERRASMDDYFKIIAKIIKRPKLPSRTKFMLQDLTELRMRQWQARREQAGPKTIDEIHKDAQAAELKKQQESLKTADRRRHGGPSGASQRRAPVATVRILEDCSHHVDATSLPPQPPNPPHPPFSSPPMSPLHAPRT